MAPWGVFISCGGPRVQHSPRSVPVYTSNVNTAVTNNPYQMSGVGGYHKNIISSRRETAVRY